MEKTPSNPYEADLLLMASIVADEEKGDRSEVTKNDSGDEEDDTHFDDAAPGMHGIGIYARMNRENLKSICVVDLSDNETFPVNEDAVTNNLNEDILQSVLKMASDQLDTSLTDDLEAELTSNTITPQTQVEGTFRLVKNISLTNDNNYMRFFA